ncbi:helix-turn-helix domain-containing protein [Acinetobacter pittii]|uniref:helix-turn-helix domain-containing protein n=1 Tax=Acinetobacter pittii TaxID=48296 RepID=UPI00226EC486|nr:helix-turn-helix domain-containing protein [Acinetobacter pittii]
MKGYVEIFDTMISSLNHFVESDKALSVKEIGYRLGLHTRTAQRITKALEESGWLNSKKTGAGKFFTATDKAKSLFKTNETLKALHNFKVNDCVVLKEKEVFFPDGTKKTNELFVVVRVGNEGLEIDLLEVGGTTKIFKTWIGDIQHANDKEIAAGCREDQECL